MLKIQESAENYLETILILQQKNASVRSIDIANELQFSKASISIAMKRLRENGYIEMDELGLIKLTEKGYEIAKNMYDRHKVITGWLVSIGVNEKTAAEDACRIEHVISQETFDRIKDLAEKSN